MNIEERKDKYKDLIQHIKEVSAWAGDLKKPKIKKLNKFREEIEAGNFKNFEKYCNKLFGDTFDQVYETNK